MSLSVATMGLAELAQFLVSSGTYSTVAEAMAALNIVIVEEVGAAAGTAISVVGGPAEAVIGTVGETALDLAARAQLAATGSGVRTASIGLLQGATATSAAAILGIDMSIVAAAAAPLLGVSLGANLYESNPVLWTKISQKLLPFCYPGTTKIPTWAEIANDIWQTSVAKSIIDALKELFEEEGIGVSTSATYESKYPGHVIYPATTGITRGNGMNWEWSTDGDFFVVIGPTYSVHAFSRTSGKKLYYKVNGGSVSSFNLSSRMTVPGVGTVWHGTPGYGVTGDIYTSPERVSPYSMGTSTVADIYYNGTITQGGYQDGTSQWEGNTPSSIPQSTPAVTGVDPVTGQAITQPMVPIAPTYPIIIEPDPEVEPEPEIIPFPWPEPTVEPHTTPWPETMPWPLPEEQPDWWPSEIPYPVYPIPQPTIDPDISPDPDQITDPTKQIEPYILPVPIPWEIPVPEPQPAPDPDNDPSQPLKPSPPKTPDPPITPDPPPPTGITPWPVMPTTPLPFAQNVGLVTVYHPTPAQLYDFESWLWVTLSQADVDTVWNNPFDGVITLFELYCTPTDIGTRTIHSGFLDSEISSAVISRYTEIDCGTVGIPEYYGNYFDYSPYSKAHVYLPFIGIQELNVDDIVGHAVNITYRIDEYNGSCIAMITVAKVTDVNGTPVEYSNTMYQFSGNCSVELPISGGSQAQVKAGMMMADATKQAAQGMAGINLVGGLASLLFGSVGGAIGGLTSAAGAMASADLSALGHMLSGKSTVQKSGSFGSSHGALGIKTPFIVVTRPKQIQVPNYNELYGYPSHKMVYISDCTGFLRCREVHVVSATASDDEKSMIEILLKSGVYVTE